MATTKSKQNQPSGAGVKTKLTLQPDQVILRPLVTEKGLFNAQNRNRYTFEINPLATKTEIKNAVESLFDVKVAKIATQKRKGKPRRYRFRYGRTKDWKKAIVRLHADHRIDFF